MSEPPIFRERLVPAWWVFAIVLALIGMVAVAYGAAVGPPMGWGILVVGFAVAGTLMVLTSPVVMVTATTLSAGRARLPRSVISGVRVLDRDSLREERGPKADARRFTLVRTLRSPVAVLVTIDDPTDPHPAWLLTSTRPQALAAALE